jgi:hypothetical protein
LAEVAPGAAPQLLIATYLVGLGIGQPVLLGGIGLFMLGSARLCRPA